MPPFRVGFITDGPLTNKSYRDVMKWVATQPDMEIGAIIVQDRGAVPTRAQALARILRRRGVAALVAQISFAALYKIELISERRLRPFLRETEYDEIIAPRIKIAPIISKSGLVYRYSDADLERIAKLDLDVMVRCGSGILKGDLLNVAKQGILSLHHGDNRLNRGGPPGFWEVLRREPTSGFIVQRLSEELDGGEVLARGSIRTRTSFIKNRVALYETATDHLKLTIRRLADGTARAEPPHIYHYPLLRQPRLGQTIAYAQKRFAWVARTLIHTALSRRRRWYVAYLKGDWRSAVLWRSRVVTNPPGVFIADPFVVEREERTIIFVEEYLYSASRATIAAYEIGESTSERLGTALEEEFHLSYPFVFEADGELFMCPETADARQIRLYRCVDFPLRWELDSILLDGLKAVDTNIFRHGEHWWMLTSVQCGFEDCATTLNAFYAPDPRGPWIPHERNPLLSDVEEARNGGMLRDESRIYRVSQSSRFDDYGNRLKLHRIDQLDPRNFVETTIESIGPEFISGACGIHHLNASSKTVVFDFWRPRRKGRRDI